MKQFAYLLSQLENLNNAPASRKSNHHYEFSEDVLLTRHLGKNALDTQPIIQTPSGNHVNVVSSTLHPFTQSSDNSNKSVNSDSESKKLTSNKIENEDVKLPDFTGEDYVAMATQRMQNSTDTARFLKNFYLKTTVLKKMNESGPLDKEPIGGLVKESRREEAQRTTMVASLLNKQQSSSQRQVAPGTGTLINITPIKLAKVNAEIENSKQENRAKQAKLYQKKQILTRRDIEQHGVLNLTALNPMLNKVDLTPVFASGSKPLVSVRQCPKILLLNNNEDQDNRARQSQTSMTVNEKKEIGIDAIFADSNEACLTINNRNKYNNSEIFMDRGIKGSFKEEPTIFNTVESNGITDSELKAKMNNIVNSQRIEKGANEALEILARKKQLAVQNTLNIQNESNAPSKDSTEQPPGKQNESIIRDFEEREDAVIADASAAPIAKTKLFKTKGKDLMLFTEEEKPSQNEEAATTELSPNEGDRFFPLQLLKTIKIQNNPEPFGDTKNALTTLNGPFISVDNIIDSLGRIRRAEEAGDITSQIEARLQSVEQETKKENNKNDWAPVMAVPEKLKIYHDTVLQETADYKNFISMYRHIADKICFNVRRIGLILRKRQSGQETDFTIEDGYIDVRMFLQLIQPGRFMLTGKASLFRELTDEDLLRCCRTTYFRAPD